MSKIKIKNSTINIVMYHYVREIKNSRYPNLKGLEFKDFKKQIDFFCNNFNVLSNDDFVEIIQTKKIPTKPSIFLTFDDGYIDHYKYVFPYLKKKKITANFYPPKKVIENKTVLDVNKIHFILEKEQNRKKILNEINNFLSKKKLKPIQNKGIKKINLKSRYDDRETILIKRLLQFYLPKNLREKITNFLFNKILNINLNEFSKILYMNKDQIKTMYKENMNFGSHGDCHYWWQFLKKEDQEKEIKNSINFFKNLGFDTNSISVCFPYGSYNRDTINLLKKYNIDFGLTTNVGAINNKNIFNYLTYPRYDTNDFLF